MRRGQIRTASRTKFVRLLLPCLLLLLVPRPLWACTNGTMTYPTFPGSNPVGSDFPYHRGPPQENSIAADPLAARIARCSASQRRNSLPCLDQAAALPSSAAASDPIPGHAGAGGARSRAISDRISANICHGTATSAI